jgi:hypothetical protein
MNWHATDPVYDRLYRLCLRFPCAVPRCAQASLWRAQAKDREVTLLIMTAAAAFLVLFERLRAGMAMEHLGRDRQIFPDLARELDAALALPFLESPFHDGGPNSWSAGTIDHPEVSTRGEPLTKQIPASQVLATIRNALAHGNLFTIGGPTLPIEALIFFSEDRRDGTSWLQVCPCFTSGFPQLYPQVVSILDGKKHSTDRRRQGA